MNDLASVLLAIMMLTVVGLSWRYVPYRGMGRRSGDVREQMEEAFAQYLFKLPRGPVPGANLILIAKHPAPPTHLGRVQPGDEGSGPTWFCMGPGPSYVVARAVYLMAWHGVRIEFAISNPDADGFRQLLLGNQAALDKVEAVEQAMGHGAVAEAPLPS